MWTLNNTLLPRPPVSFLANLPENGPTRRWPVPPSRRRQRWRQWGSHHGHSWSLRISDPELAGKTQRRGAGCVHPDWRYYSDIRYVAFSSAGTFCAVTSIGHAAWLLLLNFWRQLLLAVFTNSLAWQRPTSAKRTTTTTPPLVGSSPAPSSACEVGPKHVREPLMFDNSQ